MSHNKPTVLRYLTRIAQPEVLLFAITRRPYLRGGHAEAMHRQLGTQKYKEIFL